MFVLLVHLMLSAAQFNNIYDLVVCANLTADYNNGISQELGWVYFPDDLVESNCVTIDVCAQQNSRGQAISTNAWMHRSNPALAYDNEDQFITTVYNYHSIEYARIPAGIQLESCAPNFAHLRLTGEYVCDNNTITTVTGTCPPESYVIGTEFDLKQCLTAVQYDKEGELEPAAHGTTQMIRYSFLPEWGCFNSPQDVSIGVKLSSTMYPNTRIACADVPHGTLNEINGCGFSCDYGFTATASGCEPLCGAVSSTECASDHRANETCFTMSTPRYTCEPCPAQSGHRTLPWSSASPNVCAYEPCPTNTKAVIGVCEPCSAHWYSTGQVDDCIQCPHGAYRPASSSDPCGACFVDATVDTSTVCDAGEILIQNVTEYDVYFNNLTSAQQSTYDLLSACTLGYACLPCKPGFFEYDHACVACDLGKYQPNFKMTTCFDCSMGQSTNAVASISSAECLCQEGFEMLHNASHE